MLCLIVLNYNDFETTKYFVCQIKDYDSIDKIIIVDNASTDDSYKELLKLSSNKIDVINSGYNGGYGAGNNYGINYVKEKYDSKYIIISNPDVDISNETIKNCKRVLENDEKVAIASPMMKNIDGTFNYKCTWRVPTMYQYLFFSTYFFSQLFKDFYYKKEELNYSYEKKEVDCVAGSFLMIKLDLMLKYGMYDENIFLYCEETVLGIKMKSANLKTVVLLNDYFIHKHSVSINKSINSVIKQKKICWNSRLYVIKNYYNTNLFYNFLCYIVSKISILEVCVINCLKNIGA